MIAIPISGVIGGPVSGALLGLDGPLGLAGWQWLFLFEGLPAAGLGLVVLLYLTDRPEDAAWLRSLVPVVLALSLAAAGLLSSHGPFWTLPPTFLTGSAAAGGIALICSVANLAGFVGPYVMGPLKGASGSYQSGLLILGLASLAGAGLALWLRRAPVLAGVRRGAVAPG